MARGSATIVSVLLLSSVSYSHQYTQLAQHAKRTQEVTEYNSIEDTHYEHENLQHLRKLADINTLQKVQQSTKALNRFSDTLTGHTLKNTQRGDNRGSGEDLKTNSFYATAKVVAQVARGEVGKVFDPVMDGMCLIGCDARHHCLDKRTNTCQIPLCELPKRPTSNRQLRSKAPFGTAMYGRTLAGAEDRNFIPKQQEHLMKQPYIMHPNPKKQHSNPRLKMTGARDDDDRLPLDTRTSDLAAAAYHPISDYRMNLLRISENNYKMCRAGQFFDEQNSGEMGMGNYAYNSEAFGTQTNLGYGQDEDNDYSTQQARHLMIAPIGPMEDSPTLHSSCSCSCPDGTTDLRCARLHRKGWFFLLVTCILLFLPSFFLWYSALTRASWDNSPDELEGLTLQERKDTFSRSDAWGCLASRLRQQVLMCFGLACFIMSLGYLFMIFGPGTTINCHTGRQIFWGRLVGWVGAQPLLLWAIFTIQKKSVSDKLSLCLTCLIGLLATLLSVSARIDTHWYYYYIRFFCQIRIILALSCAVSEAAHHSRYNLAGDPLEDLTMRVSMFMIIALVLELVLWQFAEGSQWLCVDWTEFCYSLLDLLMFVATAMLALVFDPKEPATASQEGSIF